MAEKSGSGRSQLSPLPKVTQRRRQSPGKEHKSQSYPSDDWTQGSVPASRSSRFSMCTKSRSASGLNSPRGLVVTSSPAAVPLLRRSIRGCRAQVNDSRSERLGGVERTAAALCGSGFFQAESYQVVRMPGPAARVKRIAPLSTGLSSAS